MTPRKRHGLLHSARARLVTTWLDEGEEVLDSGPARWVDRAVHARLAGGDGVMYVTSARLLWRDNKTGEGLRIERDDVAALVEHPTVVPRMRHFVFEPRDPDADTEGLSFYVGRKVASSVVAWWGSEPRPPG